MALSEQTPGAADTGGDVVELTVPALTGYLGVVRVQDPLVLLAAGEL